MPIDQFLSHDQLVRFVSKWLEGLRPPLSAFDQRPDAAVSLGPLFCIFPEFADDLAHVPRSDENMDVLRTGRIFPELGNQHRLVAAPQLGVASQNLLIEPFERVISLV